MALFAIADLHLSGRVNKPMDIFGEQWTNHEKKIKENWINTIDEQDVVLIPGDISWAMNMQEAIYDLDWLQQLPGEKILLRGNHDYWWGSINKLNSLYENMKFLQNNFYIYKDMAICGTRGWLCPNQNKFTEQDHKIYERELNRLKLSIEEAVKHSYQNIIVMTHYPPTNDQLEPSGFTKIYEEYKITKVIYGHLHGKESFGTGLQGKHKGIEYFLVSCDYLNFKPLKLWE